MNTMISILKPLIPYLRVKRPAINVVVVEVVAAGASATTTPKSKDRYHILHRE